eukprot:TRINITY_DN44129_c1_g1_i1.p1 TRINITY_DN44129_c1_g1~~TRINITY_DN44129_c1_g1_i1.p1  ORF type:complete len:110 (+),score=6.06 TRINITY_DN44129_c1_g1_i1:151-480(+)
MERVGELLALFASSGVELSVLLHIWPPVPLADCLVSQRPTSNVTAADPFMNFVEEIVDFASVNALEVGPGEMTSCRVCQLGRAKTGLLSALSSALPSCLRATGRPSDMR